MIYSDKRGETLKYSEWHLKRFSSGAAPLFDGADQNIAAAHRFLSDIISLEDGEYALLLLKSIYFFVFFAEPDRRGRAAVTFETLKKAKGFGLAVRNPYPVFLAAQNLGIRTDLRDSSGEKVNSRADADYITLGFTDRKVFKGLVAFEKYAEERFPLPTRKLCKKMFPYFAAADFSFIKEANSDFIKSNFLSGYGEVFRDGAERVNALLSGAEFLIDAKTDYKDCFSVERVALKKGMKIFLFSFEFGKRKDRVLFDFYLSERCLARIVKNIKNFSDAFVLRFLHENDCRCKNCLFSDRKVIYKNKVYSVPLSEGKFSFPIRTETDFSDAIKIMEEIIMTLPAYSRLLRALKAYTEDE